MKICKIIISWEKVLNLLFWDFSVQCSINQTKYFYQVIKITFFLSSNVCKQHNIDQHFSKSNLSFIISLLKMYENVKFRQLTKENYILLNIFFNFLKKFKHFQHWFVSQHRYELFPQSSMYWTLTTKIPVSV